jgi:peptidyl-prolyl cis-trans isomerase SurA
MRTTAWRVTITLAALAFAGGTAAQTRELSDAGVLLDGVAAVVNEGVVLKSELAQQMALVMSRLREQQTQLPPRQILERQILERLIMTRIQLQRAERLGIQVPDEMLNQALASIAQRNGMSLEALPRALAAEGIDYGAYRQELREQLTLDQLRQRDVLARISVTEREIDQFLSRQQNSMAENLDYDVSHILISMPSNATPEQVAEAEARVQAVYDRLEAGEDFSRLALSLSDAQSALEGGRLGWRKGAELPTIFADPVAGMEAGEVSEPIRTASGFHIVRLNDVRGAERVIVDQVRARHILLIPNEILDEQAARQRMEEIRDQILGGDDFGAIARAVSEDELSGAEGGDLGWATPDTYVPEFTAALERLEPGELSEPVRTPFGWHLIEVLDRRKYDTTEDLQRRDAIMALRQRKLEEETEIWLRRLRDEAYVEYRI